MSNQINYLEINRGRYLCQQHGSFCDSTDNYADRCPLCGDDSKENWRPNHLDRALTILRNLQTRSARSAGMVAGLFAGAAAITSTLGISSSHLIEKVSSPIVFALFGISLVLTALSVGMYLMSMGHMRVTEDKGATFMCKTEEDWEKHVAREIGRFEGWHKAASWTAFAGVVFFVLAVLSMGPLQSLAHLVRDAICSGVSAEVLPNTGSTQ